MPRLPAPGPQPAPPSSTARGAAGPGYCARTPAGAAAAPGPGRPGSRPGSAAAAASCRRHAGLGLCSACWQRHPDRPFVQGANLAARLDRPARLAAASSSPHLAARHCAGPRLHDDHRAWPAAGRRAPQPSPGRARARPPPRPVDGHPWPAPWRTSSPSSGLALPTDQAERLAAGRRQRRIDAVPGRCARRSASVRRAHAAGPGTGPPGRDHGPAADHTIETALAIVRDLARFLAGQRGKQDWALVDVHDIEAFLATLPKARNRRLTVLRQFFRFARAQTARARRPDPRPVRRAAARASPARPSPSTSSAPCSAAGPPTPTSTRTRRCSASSPCCTAPPAARSATLRVADIDARRPDGPARQAPAPGAAGPGQLVGPAALPGPPRQPSAPTTRT